MKIDKHLVYLNIRTLLKLVLRSILTEFQGLSSSIQPIRKLAETLSEIDFCFKSGCANQKLPEVFWGRIGTLSAGFFNKAIAGVNFCV